MTTAEEVMKELVRLRKRRMIRQESVANALGVTQSRISQVERMRGSIPFELVIAYADYLGARFTIQSRSD